MASTKLAIHVPPDANPTNLTQMLSALSKLDQLFGSVNDLLEFTAERGIGSRGEMPAIALLMGLLEKTDTGVRLSSQGRFLTRVRENILGDMFHFLMYTGWDQRQPLEFLPSWAYRTACDRYWEGQTVNLNSDYLDQQVEETINGAETAFTEMGVQDFDGISFSRKSVTGIHRWLEALEPPVIENQMFTRRAFCPPELLLLAIGYLWRDDPDATQYDILLTRDKRELLCRLCLLDPDSLDPTLDWMLPRFPNVVQKGDDAGYYGRYIRLLKLPTLEDIVS